MAGDLSLIMDSQPPASRSSESAVEQAACLPTEAEMVLLCLDYLRGLRRAYPPAALDEMEGLSADYLTLACWALNRAFTSPEQLRANKNDAYFTPGKASGGESTGTSPLSPRTRRSSHSFRFVLPTALEDMEQEILDFEDSSGKAEEKKNEDLSSYEYDDNHPSNSHRFYALAGLASGSALQGSLSLPEIAAAGLAGLGGRSRLEAERDMIRSPLFEQFLNAVQAKGFFEAADAKHETSDPQELYDQRYRKVVAKFRNKLATKADAEMVGDLVALSAAEQQRERRAERVRQAGAEEFGDNDSTARSVLSSMPTSYVNRNNLFSRLIFGETGTNEKNMVASPSSVQNPADLEEAEALKSDGNTHMQRKEYSQAAVCYTSALKLCPDGPNSHVYFSNRAAAWVSMKKFQDAILDSERSLALKPDYSKAHARLGLAHFLLGNYRQAMEAYTVALKYEPDNVTSKNYLEKAAKKLATGENGAAAPGSTLASFSVVSEWEKSASPKHKHHMDDEREKINNEREAEKYKVKGNSYMANRCYPKALQAYSKAIDYCPHGSNSHVYYSNRAAALCYLERYPEAEQDSLSSLKLQPTYGKAHARLGLSRFFLRDFQGAVDAYTAALQHDPDNAASKSYLAKAKLKLEASRDARRLMEDSDFRRAAEKAMNAENKEELFEDPEMRKFAERATANSALLASLGRK